MKYFAVNFKCYKGVTITEGSILEHCYIIPLKSKTKKEARKELKGYKETSTGEWIISELDKESSVFELKNKD